ncbi:sigma E factor positive regulatory protein RseC [Shewanella hanedai]|jgi:sigma-E factor negative regulatory protein RseC|uniref:SoxR reducing system RseC family protein n=1 Tax=Shewanella hanedai TaxID=25 RepID=A0A553JHM3_SHEHA|nr:SoxR reducing system RseC family protein [Shewanella hanedai]TRY11928.1 SoxR reducing system RseC family protein [Shewanella hanedai]GGJ01519.1 sigma E factor positive regulatory protein RseC [Shewanella hanedai]
MMEEMAKVLTCDGSGWVTVEVKVKNACNHCDNSESCGTSAVSKAFSPKVQYFSIPSDDHYAPGDLLKLGLPESVILKAAALVYLLPLTGLFVGVALASILSSLFSFASSDFVVIPFALVGALLFWFAARRVAKRMENDSQPVIISHLGHSI